MLYNINNLPQSFDIGYIGEKNFRKIEIDMSDWIGSFTPEYYVPSITFIQPGKSKDDAYIVDTTFENNILTWVITDGDLGAVEGTGVAQIWLERGALGEVWMRGKSVLVPVIVHESVDEPSSTVPSAQTAWMEQMTALKVATVSAAGDASDAKTAAQTAQAAAEMWATGGSSGTPSASNNAKTYSESAATDAGLASGYKTAAEAAKDAALAAIAHYPYVDSTTGKWMVWDVSTGAFVSTGVDAQGPEGRPGNPGTPGRDGDDGTDAYVWIRYSATEPTQDSDMKTTPDAWMGIYSGSSSSAPTAYTSYTWYKIKGADGAGTIQSISMNGSDLPISGGNVNLGTVITSNPVMEGATSGSAGAAGLVPAPSAGDQTKFLQAGGGWAAVPMPPTMVGASASVNGVTGLVPAPAAGDNVFYLRGDGSWAYPPGSKMIVKDLDDVTNVSGSYTHTTTISDVTADMKAIMIELGDPSAFLDTINISTSDGSITLSCDSVEGTSTVKVSLMFVAGGNALTSSEFDVLANRIGTLSNLTTTEKSNLVGAVNEINEHIVNLGADWANAVPVTSLTSDNATFTATSSGYLKVNCVKNNDNAESLYALYIGDIMCLRYHAWASDDNYSTTFIPLAKGDIVRVDTVVNMYRLNIDAIHFIPNK